MYTRINIPPSPCKLRNSISFSTCSQRGMNVTYALRRVIILVICLTELCKIAEVREPLSWQRHVWPYSALYSVVIYIHKGFETKKKKELLLADLSAVFKPRCRAGISVQATRAVLQLRCRSNKNGTRPIAGNGSARKGLKRTKSRRFNLSNRHFVNHWF